MVVDDGERRETPISFRGRALERELDARRDLTGRGQGRGAVAARDLSRLYTLLAGELQRVQFSAGEGLIVVAALRSLPFDAETLPLLVRAAVAEAVDRVLVSSADGPALVAKVRALCPGQVFALVDAVERVELLIAAGMETAEALRQVGMVSD